MKTTALHPPRQAPRSVDDAPLVRRERASEEAAERAAEQATGSRTRSIPDLGRVDPGADATAQAVPGGGRPLAPAERLPLEARFGRDFSRVRVHTDPQAAQELSARAYTVGEHIVLGGSQSEPATPEGQHLLAHELAHTVQQQGTPGVVQRDDEPPVGGIGASPPTESFTVAEGTAEEDGQILFARDTADLPSTAGDRLAELAAGHTEPVTVEIHGYASLEGSVRYNLNLSAHRAAAVRRALLALLPEGSVVRLYAHGETASFGERANNRRAGVRITAGVPADAAQEEQVPPPTFSLRMREPTLPGTGLQPPGLNLRFTPPLFSLSQLQEPPPPSFNLTPPAQPDLSLIDWREIRTPFSTRGLVLDDRDTQAIQQGWTRTYNLMRRLGLSPEIAARIANQGLAYAYDTQLSRERPNVFDLSQQEQESLYPDEIRTPNVPIITPEILSTIVELFSGRRMNFEF
jgi:outer membrane protein OmpA-like peptidoglycan-associated protein